jgi:N-acyl homoserine lactone hydrolase
LQPRAIWIVEYARSAGHPIGGLLYGQHNAGTTDLPYCFGVIVGATRTVLVDTGYDNARIGARLAADAGIHTWVPPEEALARVQCRPADVRLVILTHAHFDHAGNLDAFPNAEFVIQDRELAASRAALSAPERLNWLRSAINPEDIARLEQLQSRGRVRVVDGACPLIEDGIFLRPAFDTHTAGSQYVEVTDAAGGSWVFPGDVVPTRRNLYGSTGEGPYVPTGYAVGSQEKTLAVMEEIMSVVGFDASRVIPQHDPELWAESETSAFDDGLRVARLV